MFGKLGSTYHNEVRTYPVYVHPFVQSLCHALSKSSTSSHLDFICSCFIFLRYLYQVRAGDHTLKRTEISEQEYIPERIYLHPNHNHHLLENEIAPIKLIQPVELGPFVRSVCLPKKEEGDLAIPGKYGFVAGWGATKPLKTVQTLPNADRFSTVLKHSAFTIQSNPLCSNRTRFPVNSTSFCAGNGKGGNDTCFGDSGGAFVREGKREDGYRWVATGLVSWREGCAQRNKFAYYTRLYPFIDWIKNTMDEN